MSNIIGYVRVSLEKQVDGFSINGQIDAIKKFATYKGFNIKDIYIDEGKSGKSIEGRSEFQRMLNDIQHFNDVIYVVVFKLSRFGRNPRDILNTLEYIQRYGINLISVEDGIDTSTSSGKLLVTVLGAVAELERENILAQSMLGREEKARNGGWNGGFAPYGYTLENGKLIVKESQAQVISKIFQLFTEDRLGYTTIARWLNKNGYIREEVQNKNGSKFKDWTCNHIKHILDNPLYTGQMVYGRRKTSRAKGYQSAYRRESQENYITCDNSHEAIVSMELFQTAQKLRKETGIKGNPKIGRERTHLLSGILKCPDCGSSMFSDKNMWTNKDGTKMETFSYVCSHYRISGAYGECKRNGVNAVEVEKAVINYTKRLLNNPIFAEDIKNRIEESVDLSRLDEQIIFNKQEILKIKSQIRNLEVDIDALWKDDKHFIQRRESLNKRLDKFYSDLFDMQDRLKIVEAKKIAAEKDKITAEVVYEYLSCFERVYDRLNDKEKRDLIQSMIVKVQLTSTEERKKRDSYIQSITYAFPVGNDIEEALREKEVPVETVVLLTRQ